MILYAGDNASVVFYAKGLVFAGMLTIKLPSIEASYAIPLLVTIADGATHPGISVKAHIEVFGVLGRGSRISINRTHSLVSHRTSFGFPPPLSSPIPPRSR